METASTGNQTFSKEEIVKHLQSKSICGAIDSYRLSQALGTISQRMIRNFTIKGDLKPIDNTERFYIYKVEDVADWLYRHPRYLFATIPDNSDMTAERFNKLSSYIRTAVSNSWQGLRRRMEMEDIVSEAIFLILKNKRKDVPDSVLVFRALSKIWDKQKRRIETVPAGIGIECAADEEEPMREEEEE